MNIYSYPVIGQFVCPDDSPNCDLSCTFVDPGCDKQPLMLQFSGPDNIVYTSPAPAVGMEWYQPVTEPGNIFSYPGSLALLKINLISTNIQPSEAKPRIAARWLRRREASGA